MKRSNFGIKFFNEINIGSIVNIFNELMFVYECYMILFDHCRTLDIYFVMFAFGFEQFANILYTPIIQKYTGFCLCRFGYEVEVII